MVMATNSSTGHTRKRQFQPSIKSYFHGRDDDDDVRLRRTRSSLSPSLPADTQASLLSVGMRVRKSIPEGYKTHKTLDAAGFPFPSTAPLPSPTPIQSSYAGTSTRELQPFCGLHKTGGFRVQDVPPSSAPAALKRDDEEVEDWLPGLTMSQSTLPSTRSSFVSKGSVQSGSSRKRTYEEEIEDDMNAFFNEMEAADAEDAQLSRSDRPMARMKPPLRKATTEIAVCVMDEDDFEEAPFLAPVEDMELDGT